MLEHWPPRPPCHPPLVFSVIDWFSAPPPPGQGWAEVAYPFIGAWKCGSFEGNRDDAEKKWILCRPFLVVFVCKPLLRGAREASDVLPPRLRFPGKPPPANQPNFSQGSGSVGRRRPRLPGAVPLPAPVCVFVPPPKRVAAAASAALALLRGSLRGHHHHNAPAPLQRFSRQPCADLWGVT